MNQVMDTASNLTQYRLMSNQYLINQSKDFTDSRLARRDHLRDRDMLHRVLGVRFWLDPISPPCLLRAYSVRGLD